MLRQLSFANLVQHTYIRRVPYSTTYHCTSPLKLRYIFGRPYPNFSRSCLFIGISGDLATLHCHTVTLPSADVAALQGFQEQIFFALNSTLGLPLNGHNYPELTVWIFMYKYINIGVFIHIHKSKHGHKAFTDIIRIYITNKLCREKNSD